MITTTSDFIAEAAHALTGNKPGAFYCQGVSSYENMVWNTNIVTGTLPTKTEVMNKAQELYDGEAMRRLREHRDILLKETDWVVTKASETGVAESDAWKIYRQALRDLPSTQTPVMENPVVSMVGITSVTWPTKPS